MADVHAAALPEDLLPQLGIGGLTRFYGLFLRRNLAILALDSERVVGFIAVALCFPTTILVAQTLLPSVVHVLASSPRTGLRFVRRAASAMGSAVRQPEVAFLAVTDRWRGNGIGTLLVCEAAATLQRRGHSELFTRTDRAADRAVGFYLRAGFKRGPVEARGRRVMVVMRLPIAPASE